MTRILITGATSMVGRSLFYEDGPFRGCWMFADNHSIWDLMNKEACDSLFNEVKPDYVIHLASLNGNIDYNAKYPSDIFATTTQIALNVLTTASKYKVKKVVSAISSCAYPEAELLVEENFFSGEPHRSVDAHGFAKRYILELGRQIYKQSGMVSVGMCFNTCYGPDDNFDLNKTKVVASLVRKIYTAKASGDISVSIWGTGNARREFIYAGDLPKMFFNTLKLYNDVYYPINVGCGEDISIGDLARLIKDVVGYSGELVFDESKPDGQMKKLLCNKKMTSLFGEQEFTPLRRGLEETVDFYRAICRYEALNKC